MNIAYINDINYNLTRLEGEKKILTHFQKILTFKVALLLSYISAKLDLFFFQLRKSSMELARDTADEMSQEFHLLKSIARSEGLHAQFGKTAVMLMWFLR